MKTFKELIKESVLTPKKIYDEYKKAKKSQLDFIKKESKKISEQLKTINSIDYRLLVGLKQECKHAFRENLTNALEHPEMLVEAPLSNYLKNNIYQIVQEIFRAYRDVGPSGRDISFFFARPSVYSLKTDEEVKELFNLFKGEL